MFLSDEGYTEVPGLPQLFIKRRTDGRMGIAIEKFVDDILIAVSPSDLENFHEDIARRFTVGRFLTGYDFNFYSFTIHQQENFSVVVDIKEYLENINPLDSPKDRRKPLDCN